MLGQAADCPRDCRDWVRSALSGAKLNLQGFQKLQKARQVLPFGLNLNANLYSLFLFLLFEKLTPKERTQFMHAINLPKEDWEAVAKLESKATKVEKELAAAKLHRPSAVYAILYKVPGEVLLFLLMRSSQRLVIDRVKNYFQKYLPAALEITEKHVIDGGAQPGTPNFEQLHQKLIAARLDTRPKRVMLEDTPAVPQPPSGRKAASLAR